ncbi:hypothetical protein ACP70R_021535 [Stipagrostis hirtigluma subsp. patula]
MLPAKRGFDFFEDDDERPGFSRLWSEIPPLRKSVLKWSREHPVIWNVGIGPTASFVQTLTRLLLERSNDLYGPFDHIIRVRLTPAMATDSIAAKKLPAVEVLMEVAKTLNIPLHEYELHELKQLAAEESYYGYGTISDNLMLRNFGREYIGYFGLGPSVQLDPKFDLHPYWSPVLERIRSAWQKKRYLLIVQNLHVPIPLDVLVFIMESWPSVSQVRRWLISTTSDDVRHKSSQAGEPPYRYHLAPEYYHAPPFGDLDWRDWASLITKALRDAANSIHEALQQQPDHKFWLRVAQHCLYYGILYHPLQATDGRQASTTTISSDELVRCWVAEDLLFSLTSPTDIPETSGKKQSNYRSAYEAGKVVIRALQEYSLLPVYSVCTPTSSTSTKASTSASSPQDAITGVSKLAMDIPRLKKDEVFDHDKSNQLRWVSFMNDDGRHVSWNWRDEEEAKFIPGEMTMSTLILRGCSNIMGFPFDKVFNHHLHVLDLSYTPISALPPGFSHLLNLHLLSLRGCTHLEILSATPDTSEEETPPLAHLGKLEVLDMNGVPLLEITKEDASNKSNLHYLDLSGSRITTLPSQFFSGMASLEELILGNCSHLKELPTSVADLSHLLVLHVEGTQITSFPEDTFEALQRLHTLKLINNNLLMSLPRSLCKAKGLKELHIYNCIALRLQFLWQLLSSLEDLYIQAWEALEDIKIHGHPNLRTFSLSGPWIRCLSLRGCSRLKIVSFSDDLTALENVDLSGTAIEEVPHNLPNLPQLRMLLLLNVPCFKRFPWHQLVRFPKIFYLDHCVRDDNQFSNMFSQQETHADESSHREGTTNTAQININDPRMFYSFNMETANKLVKKGQFLQSFNVQVKPCSVKGKEPWNKEVELYTHIHTHIQRLSPYSDVQYAEAASIVPMKNLYPSHRHVEISAKKQHPNGLRHLLSVTNSIFIMDDDFVRCLTDLNYSLMSLEECQLQHCRQMTVVLIMNGASEVLSSLKILQVSSLKNLLSFVELQYSIYVDSSNLITLKLLKHIHLEHCPQLVKIFPCCLSLPMLESLVILFCPNLKTVFYKQSEYPVAPCPLPNIEKIYLQELPQLQHIHEDVIFRSEMPKWQELFVRGCQSMRHLPLLKKEYPKSKVKVNGERDWYDKLQFLPEQSDYYLQVPPPEFASRKKSVIIKSFLR